MYRSGVGKEGQPKSALFASSVVRWASTFHKGVYLRKKNPSFNKQSVIGVKRAISIFPVTINLPNRRPRVYKDTILRLGWMLYVRQFGTDGKTRSVLDVSYGFDGVGDKFQSGVHHHTRWKSDRALQKRKQGRRGEKKRSKI